MRVEDQGELTFEFKLTKYLMNIPNIKIYSGLPFLDKNYGGYLYNCVMYAWFTHD